MSARTPDPGRRRELAERLRAQLAELAVEDFGGGPAGLADPQGDPLAGARAATLVLRVTTGVLRDTVLAARGVGCSWEELADAVDLTPLGIPRRTVAWPAQRAFELVAESSWTAPTQARWVCRSCGHRVTDFGPGPGPDHESGHDGDCGRWRRERAAAAAARRGGEPR